LIAPAPAAPRNKNRRVIVVALTVVAAAGWLVFRQSDFWQKIQYNRLLSRIDAHLGMNPWPKEKNLELWPKPERGRYEIMRAIHNSLYNWPFYDRRSTVPGKVAAIADRLDASNGADLQTFEGCVQLLVQCDEASWIFFDYDWVRDLYEMAENGTIPKLPELGKRWKNDERRKEYEKWRDR
jgi:hypothetical protein